MKKLFIMIPLVTLAALTSCSTLKNFTKDNSPTDQHSICAKMKRDIIFYRNNQNLNIGWNSPTERSALMQRYSRMNCDQVLQESKVEKS